MQFERMITMILSTIWKIWRQKEGEKPGLVPDSVYFCLDIDHNIFVGAVNIRHYFKRKSL